MNKVVRQVQSPPVHRTRSFIFPTTHMPHGWLKHKTFRFNQKTPKTFEDFRSKNRFLPLLGSQSALATEERRGVALGPDPSSIRSACGVPCLVRPALSRSPQQGRVAKQRRDRTRCCFRSARPRRKQETRLVSSIATSPSAGSLNCSQE